MQKITITSDANQVFTTLLNGIEYKFNLWWSEVGGCWYLSIEDANGNPIIEGTRILFGIGVLDGFLTTFDGNLYAVPIANPTPEIGRNDWGSVYDLYFLTTDEIAELQARGGL